MYYLHKTLQGTSLAGLSWVEQEHYAGPFKSLSLEEGWGASSPQSVYNKSEADSRS